MEQLKYICYWPDLLAEGLKDRKHLSAVILSVIQSLDELNKHPSDTKTFSARSMGELLGVSTVTVQVALKSLNDNGWIVKHGKRVVIANDKGYVFNSNPYVCFPVSFVGLKQEGAKHWNHLFLYAHLCLLNNGELTTNGNPVQAKTVTIMEKYNVTRKTVQTARTKLKNLGLIYVDAIIDDIDRSKHYTLAVSYELLTPKVGKKPIEPKRPLPKPTPSKIMSTPKIKPVFGEMLHNRYRPQKIDGKTYTYMCKPALKGSHKLFSELLSTVITRGKKQEIEQWMAFHVTNHWREMTNVSSHYLLVKDSQSFALLNKFRADIFFENKAVKGYSTKHYYSTMFPDVRAYCGFEYDDKQTVVDMTKYHCIMTYHVMILAMDRAIVEHKNNGLHFGMFPTTVSIAMMDHCAKVFHELKTNTLIVRKAPIMMN